MQTIDWTRFGMTEVPVSQLAPPALDWAMAKADGVAVVVILGGTYGKPDTRYALLRKVGHHTYAPSSDLLIFGGLAVKHGPRIDLQLDYREQSASFTQGTLRIGYTAPSVPEAGCRAMVAALLGDAVQVPNLLLIRPPENAREFHRAHLAGA